MSVNPPVSRGRYWRLGLGAIAIAVIVIAVAQNAPNSGVVAPKIAADEGYVLANSDGIVKSVIVKVGDEIEEEGELVFFNDEAEVAAYTKAQDDFGKASSQVNGGKVALALPPEERIVGKLVTDSSGSAPIRTGPVNELPAVSGGGTSAEPTAPLQPIVKGVDDAGKKAAQARFDEANTKLADLRRQKEGMAEEAAQAERSIPKLEEQILTTRQEADKQRMLLQQGAVPANASARADAAYMQAQGALQIAKNKAEEGRTQVSLLETQISVANGEVSAAQTALASASEVEVSAPSMPRATIRPASRSYARRSSPGRVVDVSTAPPAEPTRVVVNDAAKTKLETALDGARAKVDAAEEALLARRLSAPKGIRVLEILVKPGDKVEVGQPILRWKHVPTLDAPPYTSWEVGILETFTKLFSL